MKSLQDGTSTSVAEVVGITKFGIWVYVAGKEFFLPYEDFPWFRDAVVSSVYHLAFDGKHHLRWPDLDIDIDTRSVEHPENYPLIYR